MEDRAEQARRSIPPNGRIRSVWGAVLNSYYDDIFDLAAAFAVYLVIGHVFGDGNKRTASASALVFLQLNGVEVDAEPMALLDLMLEVQGRAETNDTNRSSDLVAPVAQWLRERARTQK